MAYGLSSELVHQRIDDGAKKLWLMTVLCHHLVLSLHPLRGWQAHANTQTPTQKDTRTHTHRPSALCLLSKLPTQSRAEIHSSWALPLSSCLWKGSLKAPRHLCDSYAGRWCVAIATLQNYTFLEDRSHGNFLLQAAGLPLYGWMLWSMLWDTLITALIQIG